MGNIIFRPVIFFAIFLSGLFSSTLYAQRVVYHKNVGRQLEPVKDWRGSKEYNSFNFSVFKKMPLSQSQQWLDFNQNTGVEIAAFYKLKFKPASPSELLIYNGIGWIHHKTNGSTLSPSASTQDLQKAKLDIVSYQFGMAYRLVLKKNGARHYGTYLEYRLQSELSAFSKYTEILDNPQDAKKLKQASTSLNYHRPFRLYSYLTYGKESFSVFAKWRHGNLFKKNLLTEPSPLHIGLSLYF